MSSTVAVLPPPDQAERERALNASRSVLVQAPAGSGKTDLLTRRFLRLLAEVDEPGQIVAITFTKAAEAEMRHRIMAELEKAAGREELDPGADELSMEVLAARALARSRALDWNLIDLPGQLRISTIDAFCRELAVLQPLLAGLGGGLEIADDPDELYRRAARKTLEQIDGAGPELREALETLLLWRDNGWQEMENLLIRMLKVRDRWMHDFIFDREMDWEALRARMERPFARAVRKELEELSALLDQVPHARAEALELTRFACANTEEERHRELAEMADFPLPPFDDLEELEEMRQASGCLADLLLSSGIFRQRVDKRHGFPADNKGQKTRLMQLIADVAAVPGFESALASVAGLPPVHYTDEDWRIVRACFVLLRSAAIQLKIEFAEAGAVDYTEVAQTAMQVLHGEEGIPSEAVLAIADGIRHLLVDEFQDTSRRQHQLITELIAKWPGREGRTCFVVGDPMQSIYFFRDADAELFPQVRDGGLNIREDQPWMFDYAPLTTNFRTSEALVKRLNEFFNAVFADDDGSGVDFMEAVSPRRVGPVLVAQGPRLSSHFGFMPSLPRSRNTAEAQAARNVCTAAQKAQVAEIVELIRSHGDRVEGARVKGEKYRIAVLGRAHTALIPIAEALRAEKFPFRAIELEKLNERTEVMDALALARALMNPHDRLAWLGVLRAPWCGLSLADLHALVSEDDPVVKTRPVRELMTERAGMLTEQGRRAVERVQHAVEAAEAWRADRPGVALGTWMERAWLRLGGAACVDEAAAANVDLLWRCLDGLAEGDADLTGSALDAALEGLKALPDPRADGNCGVQLMTIHKAKGLEFEVVIVPELQSRGGRTKFGLLSWLERGLSVPDEDGAVTEFLVAPIQTKGAERGKAKAWVDCEYRKREMQEARRILYVAATRARAELHFFARLEYKANANQLVEPGDGLLKTAWPAVGDEAMRRFNEWIAERQIEATVVSAIAAAEDNVVEMAPPASGALLRRLPADYGPADGEEADTRAGAIRGIGAEPLYRRHEGGLLSRALGIAVHSAFEELARLRGTEDWETTRKGVEQMKPRLLAAVRAVGIEAAQAKRLAAQAVEIALEASREANAQWILSPHAEAASEARWVGVAGAGIKAVRVDRVFRAGLEPGSEGDAAWWIVDYKTAHADGVDEEKTLQELRAVFAPQIEAYARVLRGLHGQDTAVRAGLYYPRMKKFDWWEI